MRTIRILLCALMSLYACNAFCEPLSLFNRLVGRWRDITTHSTILITKSGEVFTNSDNGLKGSVSDKYSSGGLFVFENIDRKCTFDIAFLKDGTTDWGLLEGKSSGKCPSGGLFYRECDSSSCGVESTADDPSGQPNTASPSPASPRDSSESTLSELKGSGETFDRQCLSDYKFNFSKKYLDLTLSLPKVIYSHFNPGEYYLYKYDYYGIELSNYFNSNGELVVIEFQHNNLGDITRLKDILAKCMRGLGFYDTKFRETTTWSGSTPHINNFLTDFLYYGDIGMYYLQTKSMSYESNQDGSKGRPSTEGIWFWKKPKK